MIQTEWTRQCILEKAYGNGTVSQPSKGLHLNFTATHLKANWQQFNRLTNYSQQIWNPKPVSPLKFPPPPTEQTTTAHNPYNLAPLNNWRTTTCLITHCPTHICLDHHAFSAVLLLVDAAVPGIRFLLCRSRSLLQTLDRTIGLMEGSMVAFQSLQRCPNTRSQWCCQWTGDIILLSLSQTDHLCQFHHTCSSIPPWNTLCPTWLLQSQISSNSRQRGQSWKWDVVVG